MTAHTRLAMVFALALLHAPTVSSNDASDRWHLGAFGTLGGLYHAEPGVSYRRTLQQPHGAEAHKLSFGQDSVLGAQINGRANDHLEAMIQAVSRWRADNSWEPEITWGYVRLNVDEGVALRLGRVGTDAQIDSESRLIGYASLPIRPTHELNASIPADYFDGADLRISRSVGDTLAMAKGFYGIADTEINAAGRATKLARTLVRGLILGLSNEDWSGRIYGGTATLRTQGSTQALLQTLRAVPAPQYQSTADALELSGAKTRFFGADVAYEAGPLSMQASIFRQAGDGNKLLLPKTRSTAFLAGYRAGLFTPYVQYSRKHDQGQIFRGGLGQPLDNIVQATVDSSQQYQRSRGIGVRMDVASNLAIKLQIDRVTARYSPLVTHDTRATSENIDLTLYGVALDFAY